ncbi:hypothetical protein [Brachybacterium sp. GCM10030252]|uniref:hypothetical protein n=1 Tax=Brachybacterium sp. GCM10030252 TaxID=3273380 RepID=UPI00361EA87B
MPVISGVELGEPDGFTVAEDQEALHLRQTRPEVLRPDHRIRQGARPAPAVEERIVEECPKFREVGR